MADKPLVVSFEAMQEGLRESERELRGLRVTERWARAEIAAVGKAIMLLHKIKECAEDELRSGSEGNNRCRRNCRDTWASQPRSVPQFAALQLPKIPQRPQASRPAR